MSNSLVRGLHSFSILNLYCNVYMICSFQLICMFSNPFGYVFIWSIVSLIILDRFHCLSCVI